MGGSVVNMNPDERAELQEHFVAVSNLYNIMCVCVWGYCTNVYRRIIIRVKYLCVHATTELLISDQKCFIVGCVSSIHNTWKCLWVGDKSVYLKIFLKCNTYISFTI